MPTEADTIRDLTEARGAGKPVDLSDRMLVSIATPPGWVRETIDLEQHEAHPRRGRGTVRVHTAEAFATAVLQRAHTVNAVVYADEERQALVAVLNDDHTETAGWRDHRVELALRKRPEWVHWRSKDGNLMEQEAFANHVEEGLDELVVPSASDMMDLAETFHATTNAKFKGGTKLASGARKFLYDEDIDATAGPAGEVAIPEIIELAVRPFFGAERIEVKARFRFTLRQGELRLGYKLIRPDDVERFAFLKVAEGVEGLLEVKAIAGVAPEART